MGPGDLSQTLCSLNQSNDRVLVGVEGSDDASIYQLSEELALVQTVDFITPVVDDPYVYGQIAAANSLSDVFAMGGEVLNALNLVGFDGCHHDKALLREILAGGESKVRECGGVITGGHTIETPEMYYGLSVTGSVHPQKFWRNNTPRQGDVLLLTKPLGMGVLSTAIKADMLSEKEALEAANMMAQLNHKASQILRTYDVSACTDVTGFGLLGHALEMAGKEATLVFEGACIPLLESARMQAAMGIIPAGTYANKAYVERFLTCNTAIDILFYDAQTSGGLLVALPEDVANHALIRLMDAGYTHSCIIGQVVSLQESPLVLM